METAPRISDREIIESLAELKEGQNTLKAEIRANAEAVKQLREDMNNRFNDVNNRFDDMNNRFDDLRWMLSLFITIALVILGFVLRMQWQMQRRQTKMETALETQKDELSFLKTLIEKLLPPKGVL
ncbi:MAG: hypothetical protein HZA01_04615 [Nitrospinae bacterium]|nr:hypothetical protein [Nitrospinota bacterium]